MAFELSGIAGSVVNFGVMLITLLVIGAGLAYGFVLNKKRKVYSEFKCIIWDTSNDLKEEYDSAGIFVDKLTRNKRFFMKKNKVGLSPDKVPYKIGPRGGKKVYLIRDGLKNFRFAKVSNPDGILNLQVTEEDVNWGVNAYEREKKLFGQNTLMQYLPFIALAFVSIIILIIFIYFFKNFGVLQEAAVALKEAAIALAAAKSGTLVI